MKGILFKPESIQAIIEGRKGEAMTPEEAIKILDAEAEVCIEHRQFKHADAKQLGIEALKRLKWTRECPSQSPCELLPGETESSRR